MLNTRYDNATLEVFTSIIPNTFFKNPCSNVAQGCTLPDLIIVELMCKLLKIQVVQNFSPLLVQKI